MGAMTGVVAQGNYTTPVGDPAKVQALIDLLPNPDAPHGNGAKQNSVGGNLDEMSPIAAAQLRVELTALKAAVS